LNFSRKHSVAPIIPPTISKQINTPSKQSEINTIGFGALIEVWAYELGKDRSYLSKGLWASIRNGGLESNTSTHEESIVTIPCFLPLDAEFAEACNNLPRHIEYVRAHERQDYHEKLRCCYDEVLRLECYTSFSHLAPLTTSFRNNNLRLFHILSGQLERAEQKWKVRHEQLKKPEKQAKLGLEEFQFKKIDISTMPQRGWAYFEELEEEPERGELRCCSEVEKAELQLEGIKVMDAGIKYLKARYQEVNDYLEACQKFDKALRDFSLNLECDAQIQQPAFVLRTLLEMCERSLCQDPRDKVYGILGLASNVKDDDLPVDYSKSMFELFWDVVWFSYKQPIDRLAQRLRESELELFQINMLDEAQTELVRFSQLMQRSLGGPFSVDTKFQGYMSLTEPRSRRPVHCYGFITGTVLALDFGGSEPGAALHQNEAETLKQYFRGQAGQSSTFDMVATALEQLQDVNRDRFRRLTANYCYGTTELSRFQNLYYAQEQNTRPKRPLSPSPKAQPVLFVEDSGMIGLASCNVRSDDLVVQFQNCDIAAIFRHCGENDKEFRLVGRAVVARKFGEKRKRVSESSAELFKYAVPDSTTYMEGIWLWLDAVTLQELTCPVSERREYYFDTLSV
jgi:hypothetical protein